MPYSSYSSISEHKQPKLVGVVRLPHRYLHSWNSFRALQGLIREARRQATFRGARAALPACMEQVQCVNPQWIPVLDTTRPNQTKELRQKITTHDKDRNHYFATD